ncbi:MAG: cation transporter [Oscillospiraceae bacterium]|nr:cation transporter [Oscillospiraceae bacterium]
MKKIYRLENLDCANCAAKMEAAIAKLPEVEAVTMSFMTQKMILTLAEGAAEAEVLEKVQKCIRRVEPGCKVLL